MPMLEVQELSKKYERPYGRERHFVRGAGEFSGF